eukprot:TRINITY_DN3481_c0_g1_i1.p1 TRINITY_DN3481_c0_g1~~TRINITY_DN3481_c0_g1_i1.p1  ORF type:complete len:1093 (+),score=214.39 TRINITY_DN3481_c0_g1_i1:80-3358(+)
MNNEEGEGEEEEEMFQEDGEGFQGNVVALTSFHYDLYEELIWNGSEDGRLTSFIHPNAERYSSFAPHLQAVGSLLSCQSGIISLSSSRLFFHSRGGMESYSYLSESLHEDLSTILFPYQDNEDILFSAGNSHLFIFDLHHSRILKEIPLPFGSISIKSTSLLSVAHPNGLLSFRDPLSLNVEQTLQAHSGGITYMDAKDDYILTCGWSKGRSDGGFLDPFVRIYDVRTMRPLMNVPFEEGPSFAKFRSNGELVCVSQDGTFRFFDLSSANPEEEISNHQIDLDVVVSFDMSPNGQLLGFGGAHGYFKQWSLDEHKSCQEVLISGKSKVMEAPDLIPPTPQIRIDDDLFFPNSLDFKSISSITLHPFLEEDEYLVSHWDFNSLWSVPLPSKEIDTDIFSDYRQVDFVGYATNPISHLKGKGTKGFQRNRTNSNAVRKLDVLLQSKVKKNRPPKSYRHIEIKHTKLGIDGFDFGSFNRTYFAGLENILPNSYCNSGLQTMYFIPQLRTYMLNHLCKKEFCLSCELGFLFHMLDNAHGINCQASNFLRCFRQIPQATGLGLTETPADDGISLVRLMENFNRFILEQLQKETTSNRPINNSNGNVQIIDVLFGSSFTSHSKCLSCKHETKRDTRSFQYDMTYSDAQKENNDDFCAILKTSLRRESHTKAWCETCARYQLTEQKREMTSMPNMLCINAASSKSDMEFWKTKSDLPNSWLPIQIRVRISNGDITIDEQSEGIEPSTDSSGEYFYRLCTVISHTNDQSKKSSKHSHLIAHIKIDDSYHYLHGTPDLKKSEWYMLNDFHITESNEKEVLDLSNKSPCVVYYKRIDLDKRIPPLPYVNPITEDAYFMENPIKNHASKYQPMSFVPLARSSMLQKGDIVAIDAEFVSLGAEETEIRSDGSRVVINPCHFSLARVSSIRGQGHLKGEPFLDDYIVTTEAVVDYLTRYSGIVPGDLDPKMSKHHVTTLKAAYIKLRYLIDRGCIFVGHGLAKDFRIINALVPPHQIVDTVEIYHLEGQRKISLRFLMYCLLNEDIQSETHDSTEDARAALSLYRKYQELQAENQFEEILLRIYDIGRQLKWQVPIESGVPPIQL